MPAIIEQLLVQHRSILATLERVRIHGIGSQPGKVALFGVRTELESHLAEERALLYPVLRREAETRTHLRRLLDDFEEETERLNREVAAFFERYSEAHSDGIACAVELGRLAADLRQRIHREERFLFPEYPASR
jgi:iron-sulfur cluster repair protein YtfE (RIC family)